MQEDFWIRNSSWLLHLLVPRPILALQQLNKRLWGRVNVHSGSTIPFYICIICRQFRSRLPMNSGECGETGTTTVRVNLFSSSICGWCEPAFSVLMVEFYNNFPGDRKSRERWRQRTFFLIVGGGFWHRCRFAGYTDDTHPIWICSLVYYRWSSVYVFVCAICMFRKHSLLLGNVQNRKMLWKLSEHGFEMYIKYVFHMWMYKSLHFAYSIVGEVFTYRFFASIIINIKYDCVHYISSIVYYQSRQWYCVWRASCSIEYMGTYEAILHRFE